MAITEMGFDASKRDFLTLNSSKRRKSGGNQPPRKHTTIAPAQPEPPEGGFKVSRRGALIAVATVGVTAAAAILKPWEWSTSPPKTPDEFVNPEEKLKLVHQEVKRLALMYPEDSFVRKIYLGNVSDVNPIFVSPMPVGFIDPAPYARTNLGKAEYTQNHRFRFFLNRDGSVANYATLQKQAVSISFSGKWLSTTNDEVKKLALEKEALQLALWEPFTRAMLPTYLSQGRVERLDPTVTDQEISNTFARNFLVENANIRKLYDYAGYLALLPKVEQLLAQGDTTITAEIKYSNLATIYELAKREGVKFEGLEFASTDFLRLAFDQNGPWGRIILDPAIPAPPLPN